MHVVVVVVYPLPRRLLVLPVGLIMKVKGFAIKFFGICFCKPNTVSSEVSSNLKYVSIVSFKNMYVGKYLYNIH